MEKLVFHETDINEYIGIITILDYELSVLKNLSGIIVSSQSNDKRKVIVDMALKTGMNQYRFVAFNVDTEGKIIINSGRYISPSDEMVSHANGYLREHGEIVRNSMLPEFQVVTILNES